MKKRKREIVNLYLITKRTTPIAMMLPYIRMKPDRAVDERQHNTKSNSKTIC